MDLNQTFKDLLETGWQSWSYNSPQSFIKFPGMNFSPFSLKNLIFPKIKKIKLKKPAKGWCSWYAFGPDINRNNVLANVKLFQKKQFRNLEYILIDDGWAVNWGDWFKTDLEKFPKGLKSFAREIKGHGFKPGIWLAPFLVHPQAMLVKEKPDWFVKDGKKFINGLKFTPIDKLLNINKFILDTNKTEVSEYLKNVIDYLLGDCGFELIKLDFLYGIYFDPNLDIESSDKNLRALLTYIKRTYPKVYTIGSACPLVPALDTLDSIRIGPDIFIPQFQSIPLLGSFTNKYLYSKVIKNIQNRKPAEIFWNLDPDVFVCHKNLGLKDEEFLKLQKAVLNLGGNLFLGDDLNSLSPARIERFIRPLFP